MPLKKNKERRLVDENPITNCYPNTFCSILNHHQEGVFFKSDVTFACTSLLCKGLFVCCCSVLFVSISSRHLSVKVPDSTLIRLSFSCFSLIWSASRISNFYLLFCCSNIVVFSVRWKFYQPIPTG